MKTWNDFNVGDYYEERFIVTYEQGKRFAELSHDFNPIHLDSEVGAKSRFRSNIVHGMLAMSYVSGILGNKFPGNGTIYLGQNCQFRKPIFYDKEFIICIEILEKDNDRKRLRLAINIFQNNQISVLGEAVVKYENRLSE